MLARVIEIDNLNGSRKVQSDKIPNSFGAVAQHDPLEGPAPAPPPSFRTDSSAKLFCALDRPGVRRGIRIAGAADLRRSRHRRPCPGTNREPMDGHRLRGVRPRPDRRPSSSNPGTPCGFVAPQVPQSRAALNFRYVVARSLRSSLPRLVRARKSCRASRRFRREGSGENAHRQSGSDPRDRRPAQIPHHLK